MNRQLADALTIFFLAVALVFASLSARADDFDAWDKALAVSTATSIAVDWRQTQVIAKNPGRWREMNPALGEHPTMMAVNRHFLAGAL